MLAGFRGLGVFFWPYRWQWLSGFFCMLLSVVVSLLGPPVIVRHLIDDLQANKATGASVLLATGQILLTALLANGITYFQRQFNVVSSYRLVYEVRKAIFMQLTSLDQGYFHRTKTGDLMSRLTSDLNQVREMFGFGLNGGLPTVIRLVMSLWLMIALSPMLGLVVLAVVPLIGGLLAVMVRFIAKRYVAQQEQSSIITAKVQENFSGIRVVKGYAIEDREINEYKSMNMEYKKRSLALALAEAPEWAAVSILMNSVFVIVLLLGARELIYSGALAGNTGAGFAGLTLGKFVQFLTYLFELSWPMLAIGWMANIFQRGASSWKRLQEVLDVGALIEDGPRTDHRLKTLEGEIEFKDVRVTSEGRVLLDGINLKIPKGQTLGITGRTGSGKTLLAQLVGRLIDPSSGQVLIDGHDARDLPVAVLRSHIGLVPQEPFLFSDSIAENIAFGLPNSTQTATENKPDPDVVRWAATVAGLAKDVEDFPQKYETILGERGITLSGGQRQRTALARAIARKPAILILDDSMSAVDTETEARILGELTTVLKDRTVLLIGHRVSTLRFADQILVLEHGRIIEQGSHEDLIAQGGHYAEMDRRQGLEHDLADAEAANETQNEDEPGNDAQRLEVG